MASWTSDTSFLLQFEFSDLPSGFHAGMAGAVAVAPLHGEDGNADQLAWLSGHYAACSAETD